MSDLWIFQIRVLIILIFLLETIHVRSYKLPLSTKRWGSLFERSKKFGFTGKSNRFRVDSRRNWRYQDCVCHPGVIRIIIPNLPKLWFLTSPLESKGRNTSFYAEPWHLKSIPCFTEWFQFPWNVSCKLRRDSGGKITFCSLPYFANLLRHCI